MYTKYVIVFYFILSSYNYTPTVISFDTYDLEVSKRYDEIRERNEDFITFNALGRVFKKFEYDEQESLMTHFSTVIVNDAGVCQRRIHFDQFRLAAREGFIHKYHTGGMMRLFWRVIAAGEGRGRGYITARDMEIYYRGRLTKPQIDLVMTTFGRKKGNKFRLGFFGFRRGINTFVIPIDEELLGVDIILYNQP